MDKRCVKTAENDEEATEKLEKDHFNRIVHAFYSYRSHSLQRLAHTEHYLKALPEKHQQLLHVYRQHLFTVKKAVEQNYEVIKLIIKDACHIFENVDRSNDDKIMKSTAVSNLDMEKIQSTLKQFVRDWSEEGAEERKSCYQPILDEIEGHFNKNHGDPSAVQILVPGAGLGRLAFEIARRGYSCQGNEFSLFMLFSSNFVLNKCHGEKLYKIHPWVHQYCNNIKSTDQTQYVMFPDINPSDLPPNSQFSMAAGDFLEVYTTNDAWDCVATCFFLDTANNVVSYIETIWNILKPGGIWINLGPLLYHFADMPNEQSIEPSYEVIKEIIYKMGFNMLKEELNVPTSYAQNRHSMLQYEYKSVLFVCQKSTLKCLSDDIQR